METCRDVRMYIRSVYCVQCVCVCVCACVCACVCVCVRAYACVYARICMCVCTVYECNVSASNFWCILYCLRR